MFTKCFTGKSRNSAKQLISVTKRYYDRMSTEDYLINIRKSMTNTSVQKGKLPALLEASKVKGR
jgi:hypothetical protein